MTLRFIQLYWA